MCHVGTRRISLAVARNAIIRILYRTRSITIIITLPDNGRDGVRGGRAVCLALLAGFASLTPCRMIEPHIFIYSSRVSFLNTYIVYSDNWYLNEPKCNKLKNAYLPTHTRPRATFALFLKLPMLFGKNHRSLYFFSRRIE